MESQAIDQMQQTVANAQPQTPPQNLQHSQNSKNIDSKDKLEDRHKLAIKLKLLGYRYDTIAELMTKASSPTTSGTLRQWFSINGLLHDTYEEAHKKQMEELEEDLASAQKTLRLAAYDAAALLRESMYNENISDKRIANAKDILDRTGFPKTSRLTQDGKVETPGLNAIAEGIKSILEGKANVPQQPK